MFLLRCAFFLSIVYVGILGGTGFLSLPRLIAPTAAVEASRAADAVATNASEWCARRPARCVRDAARLDALVQSMSASTGGGDGALLVDEKVQSVPLPVPDPRRRVVRSVLTEAR